MDRTTKQFIQGISKKTGATQFETIGLTDFSADAIDEEVKVLNIYPQESNGEPRLYPELPPTQVRTYHFADIPKVEVTYLDGTRETIQKSALLKVWMEGRNSKRGRNRNKFQSIWKKSSNRKTSN